MPISSDQELDSRRLRWRCRRGMRELDMLLLNYFDRHYSSAKKYEQQAFRNLLDFPDPDILALCTHQLNTDDIYIQSVLKSMLSTTAIG
ncbi:MAG: succinate dehydrogenase assembly factor 2 [Pseudomonadota bacterium]|nr:succinate dehydrogenase assembly factor 2 [Pseudomonadota bacterium]